METNATEERIDRFQNMMGNAERMGVSEFARSKTWRDRLPATGCFEVVDRGGVVGYMLAPDLATALNARIWQLEEQLEQAQIAAMFSARADRTNIMGGEALQDEAVSYLDAHADAIMQLVEQGHGN